MDKHTFLQQTSLPLTMKRLVPKVPCVAFLYSEEHLSVFHVFESQNLAQSIELEVRAEIAGSLAHDMHARVGWIQCTDAAERQRLLRAYREQYTHNSELLTEAA